MVLLLVPAPARRDGANTAVPVVLSMRQVPPWREQTWLRGQSRHHPS
ncbi:hypothetical protein [Stigmatella erecta]|nr:hypothetical protein [Stigmatella erecta]